MCKVLGLTSCTVKKKKKRHICNMNKKKERSQQGMVVYSYNSSTGEAGAGRLQV
jgi:hypothetical protein